MPVMPLPIRLGPGAAERFWPLVDIGPDCWEWTGQLNANGYGVFRSGGSPTMAGAHRVALLLSGIALIPGLEVDHLCKNPRCVNPAHLEQVTHRENVLRSDARAGQQARQTHCKNGHEFTPETTYIPPKRPTSRICRLCPNWLNRGQRTDALRQRRRALRAAA